MKKKRIGMVLALAMVLGALLNPFNQVMAVEDSDVTIIISTDAPTNQDVLIRIEAEDNLSGVKEIILPDGSIIAEEHTTYTVTENGVYEFKVYDNAGNETKGEVEISNIDKVLPVITIEEYNTEWTNEDITVNATVDKGTLNQESYTFTENGSFTFIVTDEAGNITEETVEITNIDKEKPTIKIIVGE